MVLAKKVLVLSSGPRCDELYYLLSLVVHCFGKRQTKKGNKKEANWDMKNL